MSASQEVVGRLERRRAGLERWSLVRPDGSLSNSFGADDDRDAVVAILARHGLTVLVDNTVTRASA